MAKRSEKKKAVSSDVSAQAVDTVTGAQGRSSWPQHDWLWVLLLLLAVILAYQPVWCAGFIWDDDAYIVTNSYLVGLHGLKIIWTTNAGDISPLTFTTFWVEHTLWGLSPLPYHLVNVLLHGACAIMLWRVLRSLGVPGAWLGAALWALHPVQVESVAWISETKNTQSGLFFLLSIFFFVKGLKTKSTAGKTGRDWNDDLVLLFAALAMLSKSSTVILPVVLCLCAWWLEGRWHWRNLARVAPIFLVSIVVGALSLWARGLQLAADTDPQWVQTWPQRLATAGDAVWFYLGKLLWPHPLITVYPRWEIDAGRWSSYLPLLAVLIVLSILWLKRGSRARPWFFVFAYFLTALLPTLGLVNHPILRYSLVFDHFQYLAGMGPLAMAGAGLAMLADSVIPKRCWLQSGLCAGLLLVLGTLSWQRAWVYRNEETLWTDTLAKNPTCWMAHTNLGLIFDEKGQVEKAIEEYQKALEIKPNFADARIKLGNALVHKGQMDDAMAQYQMALQINPQDAKAHNNLGNVLARKGRMDEAVAQYQKALHINPHYAEAYDNLGNALVQKGQLDEAMTQYQKALVINPADAAAQNNLTKAQAMSRQAHESK